MLPDDENPGLLEVQTTVPPHVHPQVLVGVLHAQAEGGVGHPFYHQTCSLFNFPIINFVTPFLPVFGSAEALVQIRIQKQGFIKMRIRIPDSVLRIQLQTF